MSDPTAFISKWGRAVATQEGWGNPGSPPMRLNNPGNIKNKKTGEFIKFDTEQEGWNALYADLTYKLKHYPNMNFLQITTRYLGGDPNNPQTTNQGNPGQYSSNVAKSLGVNNVGCTISEAAAGTASPRVEGKDAVTGKGRGAGDSSVSNAFATIDGVPLTADPVDLTGTTVDLTIEDGLDALPWWDTGLVGNPHLKRVSLPVVFKVMLDELNPSQYLPTEKGGATPLEVRLNCSLNTISQQMKHIVQKANSRTGFHLTFWGMDPDVITGSGSTGVFMNQWGVTDLMSIGDMDAGLTLRDAAKKAMSEGVSDVINYANDNAFKVAAQDAFIDLLSLFKNNGVARFKANNYSPDFDNRTQMSATIWSEQYGSSVYSKNARNNDVMTKGSVVMSFKGNVYQGYFKSLNWTMDAEHPFQWKFDFTFQVQRTISYIFYTK